MNFLPLLNDSCTILTRTLTTGKTDTESWTDSATMPCRVLKQAVSARPDKTQHATSVRCRFVLRKSETVAIRDRIRHGGRLYDVIEVIRPFDGVAVHHTVALAEAVAGSV